MSNEEEVKSNNEVPERVLNQKMESAKVDLTKIESKGANDLLDQLIHMSDSDLLPWEDVYLPSAGVYYGGRIPDGVVRVRPMGAQDDKVLATQRLAQTGQSIDHLFRRCVELPEGFDPEALLTGDRIFLLYYLRGITHGNLYDFVLTCSNCEARSMHTYDLNELARTIKGPNSELGPEPFKVVLPFLSESLGREAWVNVKLLRGSDTNAYLSRKKFNKRVVTTTARPGPGPRRVSDDEDNIIDTIVLSVVGFMDEATNKEKLRALVCKLHSKDIAIIRDFLKDHSPGIDTTIELQCPECGTQIKTDLPITEGFFRPSRPGSSKK